MKNFKKIIYAQIFLILISASTILAQAKWSVGADIGVTNFKMDDVNTIINDTYDNITESGSSNYSVEKQEVSSSAYYSGSINVEFNKVITGISAGYSSNESYIKATINGQDGSYNFDLSTFEIMGIIGTNVKLSESMNLLLRAQLGVGLPSAKVTAGDNSNWEASGAYFAAKAQTGVEFDLSSLLLNASISYRYADAGELKGKVTYSDGSSVDDKNLIYNDKNVNFDYSGIVASVGVRIPFN